MLKIEFMEEWEAGFGVHTGLFKSVSKLVDTGGSTDWRKGTLELMSKNHQICIKEFPASSKPALTICIKHSSIIVDKTTLKKPFVLLLGLMNGKKLRLAFESKDTMDVWHQSLKDLTK
jgi:hypothetical protein